MQAAKVGQISDQIMNCLVITASYLKKLWGVAQKALLQSNDYLADYTQGFVNTIATI